MRTTVALDDDVFACARAHARRERISLGEAVSRLAREGMVAQSQPRMAPAKPRSKYASSTARDETITTEHVRALMDQEGIQPLRHLLDVNVSIALLDEAHVFHAHLLLFQRVHATALRGAVSASVWTRTSTRIGFVM